MKAIICIKFARFLIATVFRIICTVYSIVFQGVVATVRVRPVFIESVIVVHGVVAVVVGVSIVVISGVGV